MLKDNGGQLSLEYILISVGLMFVVILGLSVYFGQNNELNSVMTSAKNGFIDASNNISYNGNGNIIRLNSMNFTNGTINVKYYSEKPLSPTNTTNIKNQMLNNIANSLNTNVQGSSVVSSRYRYTITLTPV